MIFFYVTVIRKINSRSLNKSKSIMKQLILVESPTKAKTLNRFLKGEYDIVASMGHVRDLPKSSLGVDLENKFEPEYEVPEKKQKTVADLKKRAKKASEVILATDLDREGEAIAYHLKEILHEANKKLKFERIVFHEITKEAIEEALENPRDVNNNLVDAQTARRVLDRLVGYKLSPVLWRKVQAKLSAGRVQSIALRLIVEREREIIAFESSPFFRILTGLTPGKKKGEIEFSLTQIEEESVEEKKRIKLFDGVYTYSQTSIDKKLADEINTALPKSTFTIVDLTEKETTRRPSPPFTTSTLQQAAASRYGYTSKRTMSLAQRLYEEGYITYHRTDSLNLSGQFVGAATKYIEKTYGKEYLPEGGRFYKTKSRGAQEAHEAIRPTKVENLHREIAGEIGADYAKLYDLIYKRAIASQMADARYKSTKVVVEAKNGKKYTFEANGKIMLFKGFLKVWNIEESDQILPEMKIGEKMNYKNSNITEHFTTPPPRYNEASLISSLEKHGIGRPSTYAPTISTIEDRGYVLKKNSAFHPTFVGIAVVDLLKKHFSDYVNLEFTAEMEDSLDSIAEGKTDWEKFMSRFYFGDGKVKGLDALIERELPNIEYPHIPVGLDPQSKKEIVVRIGKTFPYLQWGNGDKAESTPLPIDLLLDELSVERARELLKTQKKEDEALGEVDGEKVYVKNGPYGPYVQLGEGEDGNKPKRVSLPRGKTPSDITLNYAKKLLSLPKELGEDKETGAVVKAGIGRFGPYVARGSQYASIKEVDELFEMTLSQALKFLNEKKGGKRLIKQVNGKVEIMDGKFGPYVTDGKKIASIPKDKDPKKISEEEVVKLLENAKEKPKKSTKRRKKK